MLCVLVEPDADLLARECIEVALDLVGVEAELQHGVEYAEAILGAVKACVEVVAEGAADDAVGDVVEVLGEGPVGGVSKDDDDAGVRKPGCDGICGGLRPEITDAGFPDGRLVSRSGKEAKIVIPVSDDSTEALLVH